jgi:putative hemolysin
MKGRNLALGFVLALSTLIVGGCGPGAIEPTVSPTTPPTGGGAELANPASVYCLEQGYSLEMRTDANGQYGVCIFPDGSECEEWAFFRGECSPGTEAQGQTPEPAAPAGGLPVAGWLGNVVSLPPGSQYDDYVVLQPEGAGEVGVAGATEAIEAEIVGLRDKDEPGKYAHFWGTLVCDVPDYGACQLLVTLLIYGQTYTEPEPVESWEGIIVSNPPGSQFDDYFVLGGDFPVGYGIHSLDPEVEAQLESLRDTGITVRVWGQLRAGIPDAFGSQIEVTRAEGVGDPLAPTPVPESAVDGWTGTIVKLPPGNQHGQYFERDDGERFDIGSPDPSVTEQIAEARWTGAQVRVWGELLTGVPAFEARHIEVAQFEILSGPVQEARNLSPFADVGASSVLPADRGGSYHATSAIDGLLESPWVEGVAGPGIGEWISLAFPGTIEVHAIGLDVGFDRDADIFAANNRIKRATFIFSSGEEVTLDFADAQGVQTIPLVRAPGPDIETTSVKVVIDEVYPGSRYDDTCLGEIEVWGVVR